MNTKPFRISNFKYDSVNLTASEQAIKLSHEYDYCEKEFILGDVEKEKNCLYENTFDYFEHGDSHVHESFFGQLRQKSLTTPSKTIPTEKQVNYNIAYDYENRDFITINATHSARFNQSKDEHKSFTRQKKVSPVTGLVYFEEEESGVKTSTERDFFESRN